MKLISERVLNAVQRHKRAVGLQRRQPRIQQQRERRKHHMASKVALARRARKMARAMVRERVAGKGKGKGYNKLGVSMKIVVDRMIDKYGDRINKLAKLLMPLIRQGEMKRMQNVNSRGNVKLTGGTGKLNSSYEMDGNDILIEDVNELKLDRLLSAHTDTRNEMLLLKRILSNPDESSKIASYRKKILSFLDDLLEVITNDIQLSQRTESKLKSMNEETVNVIKKIVLETLTTRPVVRIGSYGSTRRIQPKQRSSKPKSISRRPTRLGSSRGPKIGGGTGHTPNVVARPKKLSGAATTAVRRSLGVVRNAAKTARNRLRTSQTLERARSNIRRHLLPTSSQVR